MICFAIRMQEILSIQFLSSLYVQTHHGEIPIIVGSASLSYEQNITSISRICFARVLFSLGNDTTSAFNMLQLP